MKNKIFNIIASNNEKHIHKNIVVDLSGHTKLSFKNNAFIIINKAVKEKFGKDYNLIEFKELNPFTVSPQELSIGDLALFLKNILYR